MRRSDSRVISIGLILIVLALGFYLFMSSISSTWTDPADWLVGRLM